VLSYDAINGEYVNQTLHLMRSHPISRHAVLLSKVLGQWFTLLIVFLLAWGLAIALLWIHRVVNLSAPDWGALAVMGGVTALYLAVFTSIGVACSTLTRRPPASLFLCLAIWGMSVMVLPNAAPTLASWIEATPPLQAVQARLKLAENDLYNRIAAEHSSAARRIKAQTMDAKQALSQSEKAIAGIEFRRAVETKKLYAYIQEDYERHFAGQLQTQRVISLLSPYAIFAEAVSTLTATDPTSQSRFRQAAIRYDGQYFDFARRAVRDGLDDNSFHDRMPSFVFTEPPLAERLDSVSLSIGVLVGFVGLMLAVGFWLFERCI